ncbi:MAG: hypothetical protein Q4F60_00685 [Candidatus Saccharibacteria bacterium]|nr:hypothetical protein [Candidatus Saccharibacteria bacterium]
MKNEKYNFWEKVVRRGICGVSTLIVGSGAVMMAPITMAETAGSATSDVVVTLNPVISMGIYSNSGMTEQTSEVSMSALPESWVTSPIYVGVATNNASGYNLSISPNTQGVTGLVKDQNNVIAAAVGTVSVTDMQNGATRWGFSTDGSSYKGLTASPIEIKRTNVPTGTGSSGCGADKGLACDRTDVTFGTKVGSEVESGTYTNTVKFTAVTNSI